MIAESSGYKTPFEPPGTGKNVFACTYEAHDVHLGAPPAVAVLFDNLQRIAPVVKKVVREMRLSY